MDVSIESLPTSGGVGSGNSNSNPCEVSPPQPDDYKGSVLLTNGVKTTSYIRSFGCGEGMFGSHPSEIWICSTNSNSNSQSQWEKLQGSGCGKPAMTAKDTAMLVATYTGAHHFFEWGSGGSTRVAASRMHTLQTLVSVESDGAWALHSNVSGYLPDTDAQMIFIDIDAKPSTWGHPGPAATEQAKRSYSEQLLLHPRTDFDVVLVDGRFRVACALSFVLKRLPSHSKLYFHDFFDRPGYHAILPFFTIFERGDTGVVLQARQDLTAAEWKDIDRLYEEYRLTAM